MKKGGMSSRMQQANSVDWERRIGAGVVVVIWMLITLAGGTQYTKEAALITSFNGATIVKPAFTMRLTQGLSLFY